MGNSREFTLVATKANAKEGCGVVLAGTMVQNTPVGQLAGAGVAIDGIVTDITVTGDDECTLAVARIGDIVYGLLGGAVTVGDNLSTNAQGALVKATSGVVVAKALETGVAGGKIHILIK